MSYSGGYELLLVSHDVVWSTHGGAVAESRTSSVSRRSCLMLLVLHIQRVLLAQGAGQCGLGIKVRADLDARDDILKCMRLACTSQEASRSRAEGRDAATVSPADRTCGHAERRLLGHVNEVHMEVEVGGQVVHEDAEVLLGHPVRVLNRLGAPLQNVAKHRQVLRSQVPQAADVAAVHQREAVQLVHLRSAMH